MTEEKLRQYANQIQAAEQYQQYQKQQNQYRGQYYQQQILAQKQAHRKKTSNPNDDEAYIIPMSQLITMWRARFDDKWTTQQFDDPFWKSAWKRLCDNNKFESTENGWYRLLEGL
jgi:hypothetical protein